MQIDPDALPDDPALLQQMLLALLQRQDELHAENDRLRLLIQRLGRHQFGRRSEQLTDEQLQLALEDLGIHPANGAVERLRLRQQRGGCASSRAGVR